MGRRAEAVEADAPALARRPSAQRQPIRPAHSSGAASRPGRRRSSRRKAVGGIGQRVGREAAVARVAGEKRRGRTGSRGRAGNRGSGRRCAPSQGTPTRSPSASPSTPAPSALDAADDLVAGHDRQPRLRPVRRRRRAGRCGRRRRRAPRALNRPPQERIQAAAGRRAEHIDDEHQQRERRADGRGEEGHVDDLQVLKGEDQVAAAIRTTMAR